MSRNPVSHRVREIPILRPILSPSWIGDSISRPETVTGHPTSVTRTRRNRPALCSNAACKLHQTVKTELHIPGPVRGIKRTPRRTHRRAISATDPSAATPARCSLAGWTTSKVAPLAVCQFAVDEHPLVAGQDSRFALHGRHPRHSFRHWPPMAREHLDVLEVTFFNTSTLCRDMARAR